MQELAAMLYAEYRDGNHAIPKWNELEQTEQDRWRRVAKCVEEDYQEAIGSVMASHPQGLEPLNG